jgi:ribosomal protein S1
MSIYWSRLFQRSNSSFLLRKGYALKSSVIRLREDKFLVDTGLGTPQIRMKDELTQVPQYLRTARFENKVGYSFNVVAGESTLKKRRNYERFFKDLVAGESRIKERAAANLNSFLGSLDVAAGEPLVLPRKFRQNRAWIELRKIWRTKKKAKGFLINKVQKGGYSVAIAGLITFLPFGNQSKIRSGFIQPF